MHLLTQQKRLQDTQHNDIQLNDTQHDRKCYTQHNDIQQDNIQYLRWLLSCWVQFMLNVIMLSVIMLNVVAPTKTAQFKVENQAPNSL